MVLSESSRHVPQKDITINLKCKAYYAKNNDIRYSIYIISANNKTFNVIQLFITYL